MKQRDRNILENMHVGRLRCDGPVTVGTTGLWLTRIPGQPEESPEGRGAGRGSNTLMALKAHRLKALTSLAEHFIFQKREEASIRRGLSSFPQQ